MQVGNHFLPFADAVLLNYSVCAGGHVQPPWHTVSCVVGLFQEGFVSLLCRLEGLLRALCCHASLVLSCMRNRLLPPYSTSLCLPSFPAVSLALYLHYVVSMVREICAFLCIPCLTVRKVD